MTDLNPNGYIANVMKLQRSILAQAQQVLQTPIYKDKTGRVVATAEEAVDFTTTRDIFIEEQIRAKNRDLYPSIEILGEELGTVSGDGRYRKIIDPTDGTSISVNGGEYHSTLDALLDLEKRSVIAGSVYHARRDQHFMLLNGEALICRRHVDRYTGKVDVETLAVPSQSTFFGEWLGCCVYPSKYGKDGEPTQQHSRRFTEGEKRLFDWETVEFPANRKYRIIDAKPGSGSSGMFVCDIAGGDRHFAVLMKQAVHDIAISAPYARAAGCIVEVLGEDCRPNGEDLDEVIVRAGKKDAISVAVYANEHVKRGVEERLFLGA